MKWKNRLQVVRSIKIKMYMWFGLYWQKRKALEIDQKPFISNSEENLFLYMVDGVQNALHGIYISTNQILCGLPCILSCIRILS